VAPGSRGADGVNVALLGGFPPMKAIEPGTGVVLPLLTTLKVQSVTVEVQEVTLELRMGSEKEAVMFVLVATPAVPFTGEVLETNGATCSEKSVVLGS